jgi:diadenosine tetraphosphatase ApaH/serine/threonine PP2A family protein phosphatase
VRGNCERKLVEVYDGTYQHTGAAHEPGVIWSGQQLTPQQRDHLATLPLTVSVDVDGLGPVLFCHATARDDQEIVLVDSPVEWFAEGFAGVEERTIVCGHTHMPFDRLADGRRIVNPGIVGVPYGPPGTVASDALQFVRSAASIPMAVDHPTRHRSATRRPPYVLGGGTPLGSLACCRMG